MRPPKTFIVAALAAALALTAACGGDDGGPRSAAAEACPVDDLGATPVTVRFSLGGALDVDRLRSMIRRFEAAQDDVRVDLGIAPADVHPYAELYGAAFPDDHPTLVSVPADQFALLADLGAIEPMAPCIEADAFDLSPFMEAALTPGQLQGVQWAMPANVGTHLLLYDRAAFSRAGLDPDRPPGTLAELEAAAAALHESGYEHPMWMTYIADLVQSSGLAYRDGADAGFGGREGAEIAAAVARLGGRGYLLPEEQLTDLPPVGEESAAMELADLGAVWGYASALAEGQAPGRDLAVAPMPGLHGPASPVFAPSLLVLAAGASPEERAAAWRLVAWLSRPENVADLHITTDLLPSRADAIDDPALQAYWAELPLFRQAWEAMNANPVALPAESVFPGAIAIVHRSLAGIAHEQRPPTSLDDAIEAVRRAIAALERDPRQYMECIDRRPAEECGR